MKMKRMKVCMRLLSMLLIVSVFFTMDGMSALAMEVVESVEDMLEQRASGEDIASGKSGDITWRIDANGKLIVEGNGEFCSKSYWGTPLWDGYLWYIKSAEINVVGATTAKAMFRKCKNLTSLDLSGFDTSNVTDMKWMFDGCEKLENIDLSSLDTGNVMDMSYMFSDCENLKNIDLSSLDTSNVTDMSHMFYRCENLASLDLREFDTGNVTDMYAMFMHCDNLINLDLSSFNTSQVTGMSNMFDECRELEKVDLRSFNTSRVTSMHYMFYNCMSLTSLDLSSFNTSQVTMMQYMFESCQSLENLDLSSFNTSQVTNMEYMFEDCRTLKDLDLSSFNTSQVTNMHSMFYDCYALDNLDVSGFDTGNVTNMSHMFYGCHNLNNLDVSGFDTGNVTDMSYMFYRCSLSNLDVSGFNTSQVTNMGSMFFGCNDLSNLDVSGFDTGNVTNMGSMFCDCSNLIILDLSRFNADNYINAGDVYTNAADIFSGCDKLDTIYTPYNLTQSVPLPATSTDTWYRSDGIIVTELPQNLGYSVALGKNYIPEEKVIELDNVTIGNPEIDCDISISKDKSAVKIIDGRTGKPISHARVWTTEVQFTDEKGIAELSQTGLTTIQIEKEGYHKKTVKKKLNKGQPSIVILCPDTGEMQVFSATLNLTGEDEDILDNTVSLLDRDIEGDTNVIAADFTLRVESAGRPVKYQLIQNGKVIQTCTDGVFTLPGHYSNSKKGKVSYFIDDFSAGYGVSVRIFDNEGKRISQKLGIKVSKGSSSVLKTIYDMEDSHGKVDFGDKLTMTIPDSIPMLGGIDLEFGFQEKLPIQVSMDSDTGLVKVALNMEDDIADSAVWYDKKQEFENLKTRAKSLWKSGVGFGGMPEPFGASMFSVKGSIMGYGEGYLLDNSDSLRINLNVIVSVQAEAKVQKYFFIPIYVVPVPVYVNFAGGISCGVSGGVNLEFGDSGMLVNGGSLEFEPSIYVKPEAGVGVDGVLSLSACGKIDVTWLYRYLNNYSRVTLNGSATLKGTVLWGSKEWEIWKGTRVIYESKQKSASSVGKSGKASVNYLDMSNAKPISMDYLTQRVEESDDLGISVYSEEETECFESERILNHAYENASPRLVQADNKMYLFYLDGVEGRSVQDQTSLFYRISSDNGVSWTEAYRADNGANETADYNFDVAVNGDKIYAVWSDAGKVYGDELLFMESVEALAKTAKEMDLMLSVIDANDGTVRKTAIIQTDDADMQPQIAVGNDGIAYVTWITNDVSAENGIISNDNKMSLCYASSEDGYTVHGTSLAENLYPLTLDIGMLDSEMWIAADLDTDADLNTQEDREIYTMSPKSNGTLSVRTSNNAVDSVPLFGKVGGTDCLFWYCEGNIAYTLDGKNVSYVFEGENLPSIGQEFSLLEGDNGNSSIVWASTSLTQDLGVDVYSTVFDGNMWSAVYKLGSLDSEYTGRLSGYMDASGCRMAYLGNNHENDELYSHISLYTPKERIDTSIVWYTEDGKKPGESYPLHMTVTNNGNKTVESLSVISEDGSIQDEITGLSIEPGTSEEITWGGISLPEEMAEIYSASLKIIAEGETDTEDNVIDLSVGEPDLSVESYQDFSSGEKFAGIEVTNNGILTSDAVLTVYKDEDHKKELYKTSLQSIKGGESRIVIFDLSVMDEKASTFYFVVSNDSDKETYMDNNQAFLYIGKGMYLEYEDITPGNPEQPENPGTGEGEKPGEGEEKPGTETSTKYTYKLNDDKTAITITKCTSSDENIVIPSAIDGYTVTEIGDKAFQNVTSMKTVSFPSTLKSIGNYALVGCTSLTTVTLPDSLTNLGTYVFKGCTSLKSAKLNAGRINVTEGLFQGCTALSSVTLPNSIQYIRQNAFSGCTSLKKLSLPKSLSIIYANAFLNSGIKTIQYAGTSTNWQNVIIGATGNTLFLNATVTGSTGKTFSANKSKWNTSTPAPVKKPTVAKVKSFKAKAAKKKLTLTWKKLSGTAGYQIQISTKKNFKGAKKISISKSKKTYTKKKLKAKKKYYIRIRAYKTYKDANKKTKKVYGKWTTISKKTK